MGERESGWPGLAKGTEIGEDGGGCCRFAARRLVVAGFAEVAEYMGERRGTQLAFAQTSPTILLT